MQRIALTLGLALTQLECLGEGRGFSPCTVGEGGEGERGRRSRLCGVLSLYSEKDVYIVGSAALKTISQN